MIPVRTGLQGLAALLSRQSFNIVTVAVANTRISQRTYPVCPCSEGLVRPHLCTHELPRVARVGRAEPQAKADGAWTTRAVAYVGFDTSKTKHAAEGGREGEVRYLGEIEAVPA